MKTNDDLPAASRSNRERLLLLMLVLATPLLAQVQQGFKGTAWKFPDYYETPLPGERRTYPLKGLISGEQGRHLSNSVFLVTGMRLEHYERDGVTNLIARAPECLFDRDTRTAWSTGRLEIIGNGGQVVIRGNQGFQANMTNTTLIISNRVRTVIEHSALNEYKP